MKKITLAFSAMALTMASMGGMADNRADWPSSMTMGTASQGGTY